MAAHLPIWPGDVVASRLGLGLGGRRSTFWPQVPGCLPLGFSKCLPLPSTPTEGEPVRPGVAESMDWGAGLLGFQPWSKPFYLSLSTLGTMQTMVQPSQGARVKHIKKRRTLPECHYHFWGKLGL